MLKIIYLLFVCILFSCTINAQQPYKMIVEGTTYEIPFKDLKQYWDNEMTQTAKQLNSQCPIPVGNSMEVYNVVFIPENYVVNYKIFFDSTLLSENDSQAFKQEMRDAAIESIFQSMQMFAEGYLSTEEWMRFFKELNFCYNLLFYDNNGRIVWKIDLNYLDFQNYLKAMEQL